MNNIKTTLTTLALYATATLAFGQGSLTPPGAPTPTMKTLDQVEPRIPISATGYEITAAGSYYLTTNLVASGSAGCLQISASDVSVDLNGFAILGAAGTGNGIYIQAGIKNVCIRNGTIRDCYYHGIYATSAEVCIFRRLRIIGNGRHSSTYDGLCSGTESIVEQCVIRDNGGDGIYSLASSKIIDNTVENNHVGLHLAGTDSYIAGNIVKGNSDNYNFADGNRINILLCEVPEILDWPCSVKFAGTLTCAETNVNGITVNSDDVTIDLDGHTLIGSGASSGHGIYQDVVYHNLAVKNGKFIHWAGSTKGGIHIGPGCTVTDCVANDNGGAGIRASSGSTVTDCVAYDNGGGGIRAGSGSTVSDCVAYDNGADGICTGPGCTVSGCAVRFNTMNGIYTSDGSTVSGCTAQYATGDGIQCSSACHIIGNTCNSNGHLGDGAGIHATSDDNRIDGNTVTDNDRGIDVDHSGNFIVRNSASGNTADYDIVSSNDVGTIQTTPIGAGAWDNFRF